ncbi:hypothetical protein HDZ31DRAFT_28139 [Schizophyllum fasciatum]
MPPRVEEDVALPSSPGFPPSSPGAYGDSDTDAHAPRRRLPSLVYSSDDEYLDGNETIDSRDDQWPPLDERTAVTTRTTLPSFRLEQNKGGIWFARNFCACLGALVLWTAGSVWITYPYSQHAWRNVGWQPRSFEGPNSEYIRLASTDCTGFVDDDEGEASKVCKFCRLVPTSAELRKLMERAKKANIDLQMNHRYFTYEQLDAALKRVKRLVERLQRKLVDHQRILKLIGSNDVKALRRLVNAALRRGVSARALAERIENSINLLYTPSGGFSELDFDKAYMVKALGGPRLLYALSHAEGYPSLSTLARRRTVPQVRVSVGKPEEGEISESITDMLQNRLPPDAVSKIIGFSLLVDDVSIEELCRYCPHRDLILGVCREHSGNVDVRNTSVANIDKLVHCLKPEEGETPPAICHFGKDATVVALAPVTHETQYSPIPVIVSPTCKKETGKELAAWLGTVVDVWERHPHGAAVHGPLRSLASDGASAFRVAQFDLCMSEEIDTLSPLGKVLCQLDGLNLRTGKGGILGTCDPKHVIKRFASWLRSMTNILVGDIIIMPHHTLFHLADSLGSDDKARDLMDPADKMNVPKAVKLVQELRQLEERLATTPLTPPEMRRRRTIIFIAKILDYFILPFTSVDRDMSLSIQVRSLSTYAHITAAMYLKHRLQFLTGAVYADAQAIIKTIVVNIARYQLINPDIKYWIIHEGTDRLENIFSNVRTQDHSRNFDILQLSQKLSVAAHLVEIFMRNPELDRGHRRREYKGAAGIDRMNPQSWPWNVRVGDVDLAQTWREGADQANDLLEEFFGSVQERVDWATTFEAVDCDLLRPQGVYIGTTFTPADGEPCEPFYDDERAQPPQSVGPNPSGSPPNTSQTSAAHNGTPDDDDLDDQPGQLGLEDFLEESSLPEETAANRSVCVEGENFLKMSYIPAMLSARHPRKVSMRTLRAKGVKMELFGRGSVDPLNCDGGIGEDGQAVKSGDPVACLVRCGETICLAIIEVDYLEQKGGGKRISRLPLREVAFGSGKSVYFIIGQILDLIEHVPTPPVAPSSAYIPTKWRWTETYIRYGARDSSGSLDQRQHIVSVPCAASVALGARVEWGVKGEVEKDRGGRAQILWVLAHKEMATARDAIWATLTADRDSVLASISVLPTLEHCTSLPYRSQNGLPCPGLIVEDLPSELTVPKLDGSESAPCKICGAQRKIRDMRTHNPDLVPGIDPCGWCGVEDCRTTLTFDAKGSAKLASTCTYHYSTMRYSAAKDGTKKGPSRCTNVPLQCSICPPSIHGQHPTFWKYNAITHLTLMHGVEGEDKQIHPPAEVPPDFLIATFITSAEELRMHVSPESTLSFRDFNSIPGTDGITALAEDQKDQRLKPAGLLEMDKKRERAFTRSEADIRPVKRR